MKKERKGMFNASVKDGVQYRRAGIASMCLSAATRGTNLCFYSREQRAKVMLA